MASSVLVLWEGLERILMRYPIFVFDGDDLIVFSSAQDHWDFLEAYNIGTAIVFDSDGRPLREIDAGSDRVNIEDVGAKPEPQRFRGMLLRALRMRRYTFDDETPLEDLVVAAQREYGYK